MTRERKVTPTSIAISVGESLVSVSGGGDATFKFSVCEPILAAPSRAVIVRLCVPTDSPPKFSAASNAPAE